MMSEFNQNKSGNEDVTSTQRFAEDLIEDPKEGLDEEELAAVAALPQGSALLIVKRGPSDGSRFLLDVDVTCAGRHPNAEIFLDDVTVSRKHAEFRRDANGFTVTDLASLNGTYVNGDRVDAARLTDGDEVQVGKFKLTFYAASAGRA
jgi:pSer/pThr/pTyr-binding forkhead associated (FHA) protein